jgi:hypothetical protein
MFKHVNYTLIIVLTFEFNPSSQIPFEFNSNSKLIYVFEF